MMKNLLIRLIQGYQKRISPLKKPCCRFYPTCSEYAILAIRKYGAFRGTGKAVWRILRCNPLHPGGIDFP
ncbi:MAG: membrane protein insertion efficiency factor YidD [Clostridia bacterium]|nr:membrane protein insertion efficiency factor YidD [Clostridia bacterium]